MINKVFLIFTILSLSVTPALTQPDSSNGYSVQHFRCDTAPIWQRCLHIDKNVTVESTQEKGTTVLLRFPGNVSDDVNA